MRHTGQEASREETTAIKSSHLNNGESPQTPPGSQQVFPTCLPLTLIYFTALSQQAFAYDRTQLSHRQPFTAL